MYLKNTFPSLKQIGSAVLLIAFSASLGAAEEDHQAKDYLKAQAAAGYNFVSTDDNPGRAAEYTYLHSSSTASLELRGGREQQHFYIDLRYQNEADYQGEVQLDYKGLLRLDLSTESLFHNLDHLPSDSPQRTDAFKSSAVGAVPWIKFTDNNPGDKYFVEVEQNRVGVRAKIPDYPAHLNINYWRLERSGRKQQRFFEHGGPATSSCSTNQCHAQSQSRTIDRVTEEVKAGADAHIGPVDLIVEHLVREFRDREPIPRDPYNSFNTLRLAGNWQHDEDPDSRLIASTLKLHTSLSGGVVGAASFTMGKRENRSDLSDVRQVESETDFRKSAGDLTWIPSPHWTFNFRYRLLDMDNSNSSSLTSDSLNSTTYPLKQVDVRDNIDLTRATYAARVTHRSLQKLTIQGEFERKDIHRGNAGAATFQDPDPVWEVPKDEIINRYRLGFIARPLRGNKFKVNGWYQYLTSDDPAYGASAEDTHTAFIGTTYSSGTIWGVIANLKLEQQESNRFKVTQFTSSTAVPVGNTAVNYFLDRDRKEQNINVGAWLNPHESVMLGINYGFLNTRILQDLLFGTSPFTDSANPATYYTIEDKNVEYSQRVQTVSATVGWQILKTLKGHAEAYHIRSYAAWDPEFSRSLTYSTIGTVTVDSSELKDISKLDIRQNGLRVGLDWQMTPQWGTSFNYTFDDYEDRDTSYFDGTAQTYMVSLARTW